MITRIQKQYSTPSSQSGFTIIESLMAIVVVGILMSAIAPVIVLSVATRVQARRVELATQAGRAYIDSIKSEAIAAPIISTTQLDRVEPPTIQNLNCSISGAYCTSPANLYCVNNDEEAGCTANSSKDMLVQAFGNSTLNEANKGYKLGLRVYRADAFNDSGFLTKGQKQATFTGGMGNRKAPLVEMTTEIVTDKTRFRDFCDRLGGC